MALLETKPITVETQNGQSKTYLLSKFPAIQGREIISKYPLSAIPKVGDYGTNEETMLKLMAFVGVDIEGNILPLTSRSLIENHVPDWETLMKIEKEMITYNCSFFMNGQSSIFLDALAQKAKQLITKTLTDILAPSSKKAEQPSTNSEQSTL